MKRFLTISVALALLLGVAFKLQSVTAVTNQDPKKHTDLGHFMELKLEHTKGILEGVTTEDFEMIAKEAQLLKGLSLESSWNVHTTQEYLEQSSDFRRTLQVITDAAHERNLDRAALGYIDLTVRCLECHRYLRKNHSNDDSSK